MAENPSLRADAPKLAASEVASEAANQWINRAALYEILALAFLYTRQELADALVSGEYAEALAEIVEMCGIAQATGSPDSNEATASEVSIAISELTSYIGRDPEELFHELRREHTRLFVGAPKPVVSPYAGTWWAEEAGVEPLLFVNKESMAVERFLRSCGVGQPEGTNEPLDHIGTELEFLQYLSLIRSGVSAPPEGVTLPEDAYERFFSEHFSPFAQKFATATQEQTPHPLYHTAATILHITCE